VWLQVGGGWKGELKMGKSVCEGIENVFGRKNNGL
jgi:hypothetical protein